MRTIADRNLTKNNVTEQRKEKEAEKLMDTAFSTPDYTRVSNQDINSIPLLIRIGHRPESTDTSLDPTMPSIQNHSMIRVLLHRHLSVPIETHQGHPQGLLGNLIKRLPNAFLLHVITTFHAITIHVHPQKVLGATGKIQEWNRQIITCMRWTSSATQT
mgnify:CR=1 FL=1